MDMRKINLLLLCLLLLSACDVTTVVIVEGYDPVTAPSTPSGVSAADDGDSYVTVSWDAADNASGYSLWRASADTYGDDQASSSSVEVYAELEERGFQRVATVSSSVTKYEDTVSSGVYVYAVVAFRDFSVLPSDDLSSGIIYSSPSDFAECYYIDPSDTDLITVSGWATSSSFVLAWDVSVMYSVLGDGALYDYSFLVEYRLSGDEAWEEAELEDDTANSAELELEDESIYDFRVTMYIYNDEGSVVNEVSSEACSFEIDYLDEEESV